MNDIRIFDNPDFGEVRTVMIDGEPWFSAIDISNALGYTKTFNMMKRIDEDDKRNISSSILKEQAGNQSYMVGVINESGVYAAIFGSKLDSAKKFKHWVTSEVLPQLRKTGSYKVPQTIPEQIQLLAQGNVELNRRVDNLTDRMDKIELDLPILPIEADRITTAARKRGTFILGGKGSVAYKNRIIRQRVYSTLYSSLKYNFGVRSYKSIKRIQCDKAVEIIERWEPPVFLADQIASLNK